MPRKVLSQEEVVTMLTLQEKACPTRRLPTCRASPKVPSGTDSGKPRTARPTDDAEKAFAAKYDAAIRSWVRAQQDPEGEAPSEPESDMPVTG